MVCFFAKTLHFWTAAQYDHMHMHSCFIRVRLVLGLVWSRVGLVSYKYQSKVQCFVEMVKGALSAKCAYAPEVELPYILVAQIK